MAGATSLQEQCSIIAMYYAIDKGSDTRALMDLNLKNVLYKTYRGINTDWYTTFLEQADAVKNYLGVRDKDTSYKYGWFDGSAGWNNNKIPSDKVTSIVTDIWDVFTRQQRDLFGNKKDSWNTADVYMVKASKESEILKEVKDLHKLFTESTSPEIFVGVLKTYMSKCVKNKWLIPISLKKRTSGVKVTAKENNVEDYPVGKLKVIEASFDEEPYSYFEIQDRGELDFKGNSFKYKASFTVGSYKQKYLIEQRMQGSGSKQEVKDIVATRSGAYKAASAQTGLVPAPKFTEMILEYAKEEYNYNIPNVNTSFTEQEKEYWKDYFKEIYNDNTFSGVNFGTLKIMGKQHTPEDFMEVAISIDDLTETQVKSSYGVSKGDYSAKLRNKLRHLRFMKAFINAKVRGDEVFGKFICEIYYRAAKMNMDESELAGPFIKIS
jgi:hypothetical protein